MHITFREYVEISREKSERNARSVVMEDMPVVWFLATNGFARGDVQEMSCIERDALAAYLRMGTGDA